MGKKNDDPRFQLVYLRITEALGTEKVKEIEDLLGVTKSSIYDWRSGGSISFDSLYKISDKTGCSLHWLLTGEGPRKVDIQPGYYVELGQNSLDEIAELARRAELPAEEQLKRLILAAIITVRYTTETQLPEAFIGLALPALTEATKDRGTSRKQNHS